MKALSIHIPTPCHEDWQQMTPVDKGRFCQSCAKQVVDFTAMTDQEILNYISKASGGMCGRFAGDQLQRPLQTLQTKKKKSWWIAAMMPLLLLFEKAGAQKKGGYTKKEAVITNRLPGLTGMFSVYRPNAITAPIIQEQSILGRVINANGQPVAFAAILVNGKFSSANTNADGFFNTAIPKKYTAIFFDVVSAGYEPQRSYLSPGNNIYTVVLNAVEKKVQPATHEHYTRENNVTQNTAFTVEGTVVDSATNEPVAFAAIAIKNTKTGVAADVNGRFKLHGKTIVSDAKSFIGTAPGNQPSSCTIIISAVGYEPFEISLPVNDSANNIQLDTIHLKANAQLLQLTVTTYLSVSRICDLTLGYTTSYIEPAKWDTIPTLIRKVFNAETFKVFPNPALRGSNVTVEIRNKGTYSVQLFDNNGKLLQAKPFDAMADNMQTSVNIPPSAAPGMYYIVLVDDKKKKRYTDKIIVQ